MTTKKRLYLIQVDLGNSLEPYFRLAVLSPSEEEVLARMLRNVQSGTSHRLKSFHIVANPKLIDDPKALIRDIKKEIQQPGTALSQNRARKESRRQGGRTCNPACQTGGVQAGVEPGQSSSGYQGPPAGKRTDIDRVVATNAKRR